MTDPYVWASKNPQQTGEGPAIPELWHRIVKPSQVTVVVADPQVNYTPDSVTMPQMRAQ